MISQLFHYYDFYSHSMAKFLYCLLVRYAGRMNTLKGS